MERTQFTFYESFFRAINRIKKKSDRADAYDAICVYALYEQAPDLEKISDSAAIAFELIKPNLDSSRKKARSGKLGGSAKQTESKPKAKWKQTASEKEKEKEKEKENECYPPTPLSAVMTAYMDRINPTPSETSLGELKGFVEQMGAECCLRAFDIALDNQVTKWPYIKTILQAKLSQGVRCLADWDRLEKAREQNPDPPPAAKEHRVEIDPETGEEVVVFMT